MGFSRFQRYITAGEGLDPSLLSDEYSEKCQFTTSLTV